MPRPALHYRGHEPFDLADAPAGICVVRNEMLRLPAFLEHYRRLGLGQFIVIDNDSSDGSTGYLDEQKDVLLFHTRDRYADAHSGIAWVNAILDRYCAGRWILFVDADELLVWPGMENDGIDGLVRRLDAQSAGALFTVMLDMYADRPFGSIGYERGASLTACCPFFDPGPYRVVRSRRFPFRQVYGGVRARIFREMNADFHPPTISKVPMVRWREGQHFAHSAHALGLSEKLPDFQAALLHFKMLDDFVDKCAVEANHRQYYAGGREYRLIGEAITKRANASFHDPDVSVRYTRANRLVEMGLLQGGGAPAPTPPGRRPAR